MEIPTLREGISLSLQWSSLSIDVESNYLEVVAMVKSGESNLSNYSFIIEEIKQGKEEPDSSKTQQ